MLDLVLIMEKSGITLFEFKGEHCIVQDDHSEIFSGFISAVSHVAREIAIGNLTLISTKTHHCIVRHKESIIVVTIVDVGEDVGYWTGVTRQVARAFQARYFSEEVDPYVVTDLRRYQDFSSEILGYLP
ncbi:MAG: hypothetical protein ACTSU5_10095 [Promethearchaeota archaeon]